MKVETVAVANLKPYDRNPRKIPDSAIKAVADSIKKFGWQQPIVADENNVVVVGHTRLKAAQKLGIKEVPVKYVQDLSEDEVAAYRLLDNRVGELTSWDSDILEQEIESINFDGLSEAFDFDKLDDDLSKYDFEDGVEEDAKGDEDTGRYGPPVIQYVLIFDTEDQQAIWNAFLRSLKNKYDGMDTHAERLIAHIKAHG